MADPSQLLDDNYGPGSQDTSDILSRMPASEPYADPRSYLADYLRRQDKMTPDANERLGRQSLLGRLMPAQMKSAISTGLGYIPPDLGEYLTDYAAFIGPRGSLNLKNAGIRHADDWGGINRLTQARARPEWGSPEGAASIWQNYGWTSPTTWGTRQGQGAQPATVVPTPRFALNEEALSPMKSGKDTIYRGEGLVPELVHGLDELMVAEPSLAKLSADVSIDPSLRSAAGSTAITPMYPSGYIRRAGQPDPVPVGFRASNVRATGSSPQEASDIMLHELQHATAAPQGVAPLYSLGSQQMHPIMGTKAETALRQEIANVERRLEASMHDPHASDKTFMRLVGEVEGLKAQLDAAPGRAGYLDLAEERIARENFLRGKSTLDQQRNMTPGSIDTYQQGAMGDVWYGVPLRYYDPRRP